MKNKFPLGAILIGLGVIISSLGVEAALFDRKQSLEGSISNISSNLLTISQTEMTQKEEGAEIAVEVNDKTKYQNISSLEELNEGDLVEVQYEEREGRKIATKVMKKPESEKATEGQT